MKLLVDLPYPLTEADKAFAQYMLDSITAKQESRHGHNSTRDRLTHAPANVRPLQPKCGCR